MDSPKLQNHTDFLAEPRPLIGKEGDELAVIVKATFARPRDSAELELAPREAVRAIRSADLPWGDPEKSSIKYPSDLCLAKPGTDVIVVARAYAPGDKPVPWFDAGLQAGSLRKLVRIFGLRVWESGGAALSAPRPGACLEVRYDHAWGGLDLTDLTQPVEEPRNPVGVGIARDLATLTHKAAPSIEDPADPIRSARGKYVPAGLGAIGRSWEPRRRLLGTYDAQWLEERAPLLPADHDERGNLCASAGLVASPPFKGGEEVALWNLTLGGGSVAFRLPKLRISIELKVKPREGEKPRDPQKLFPYLDTVIIDTLEVPDDTLALVELVWRARFRPPRRMKDATVTIEEQEAK